MTDYKRKMIRISKKEIVDFFLQPSSPDKSIPRISLFCLTEYGSSNMLRDMIYVDSSNLSND